MNAKKQLTEDEIIEIIERIEKTISAVGTRWGYGF